MKKKRGPKFKKRRSFDRESAFPKKVAQEKMAEEMEIYQHLVMGITRAFPDREERLAYMQSLIDGLTEEIENVDRSCEEDRGDQNQVDEVPECGRGYSGVSEAS
jgi:hypothetical protein